MVIKDVPLKVSEGAAPLAKCCYIFGCESLRSSFMATESWLSVVGIHKYTEASNFVIEKTKKQQQKKEVSRLVLEKPKTY